MSVIYPVITLAFLTFALYIYIVTSRVSSVQNGIVQIEYYQLFKGGEPPEAVLKSTRHLANLYEAPVLFYLVCVLIMITNVQTPLLVGLAWSYVVLRVVHSVVHLTYNKVFHRLGIFMFSQIVLIIMWVLLLLQIT